MRSTIDGYSQMTVFLSEEDVLELQKEGTLEGEIYRISSDDYLPLKISLEKKWRAHGVPPDKPYEEKTSYEVAFPRKSIEFLLAGNDIGADLVTVSLRSISVTTKEM